VARSGSLGRVVRLSPAEALEHVDPDDGDLEGVLYVRQVADHPITEDEIARYAKRIGQFGTSEQRQARARASLTFARLMTEGKRMRISGGQLCSEARLAFELDGVTYPSIHVFYDALKIPAGELRTRFVAGAKRSELGVGRGHGAGGFRYGDAEIEVGSRAHLRLIARAVSAKVAAHPAARNELAATKDAMLFMGGKGSQPLARAMPFALMVERLRMGAR
jgi:hypothetical protein